MSLREEQLPRIRQETSRIQDGARMDFLPGEKVFARTYNQILVPSRILEVSNHVTPRGTTAPHKAKDLKDSGRSKDGLLARGKGLRSDV